MSTSKDRSAPFTDGNSRRQPPHLSVSLRHEMPAGTTQSSLFASKLALSKLAARQRGGAVEQSSDEYDEEMDARKWFESANMNPHTEFGRSMQDEPPYFISQASAHASSHVERPQTDHRFSRPAHTVRSGSSSSNGYRSIIDDLTVANRKLKEENKKLKRSHNSHLAKDRIFEVTIHQMSAQDRRRLERQLREFAESVTEPSSEGIKTSVGSTSYLAPTADAKPKHSISSLDSIPLPIDLEPPAIDSAYSSMTNLLPIPIHLTGTESTKNGNTMNIESYLENIPDLPKHFAVMTERQKEKLVVKRLEQLFTGKRSMQSKSLSQPQQQEEVSQSARRPEERVLSNEGAREAHMLLNPMDIESRPGNRSRVQSTNDYHNLSHKSQSPRNSPDKSGQRPTRPLDLDPDRAQVAVDNVEYLRHLGLSTPQLLSDDSSDAEPDAQGWIYLNLLISMAQLHILNVTPDFVRQAVKSVSEKFQLSRDGDKLRWRGGSQGTQLSSDSGTNSRPNQSPNDSDSLFNNGGKRRKVDGSRFATIPIDIQKSKLSKGPPGGLHYRPVFAHHNSSSDSSEMSSKSDTMSFLDGNDGTGHWRNQHSWSATSGSGSQNKKRREDGAMVFYNNAQFWTDLSGDLETTRQIRGSGVGEDAFSNMIKDALGCRTSWPTLSRTPSGSSLAARPFKEEVPIEMEYQMLNTPDLLVYNASDDDTSQKPGDDMETAPSYQNFEVCGFNGVRPEDHFAVHVCTRRTRIDDARAVKLSNFSAPGVGTKKFHHRIPDSALASFAEPDVYESVTNKLSSLTTLTSSSPMQSPKTSVVVEYSHPKFVLLEPSPLPAPIGYFGESTGEDSPTESPGESILEDHVSRQSIKNPSTLNWTKNVTEEMEHNEEKGNTMEEDVDEEEGEDEDDDDDDESIDMLAHLRATNPEEVARREAEFEMEIDTTFQPRSSVAATVSERTGSTASDEWY